MKKSQPNYPIKVLNKSLSILEILLKQGSAMNMTELSKKLGFYPSTIHRILDTLKHWGYVEQDSHTQKYQLGLKALELGMAKLHQMDLVREATPYLKELVNQCNETVHLGVLEEGEVLYLAKEESSQTIRMCSYVGKRAPLHCTALGKVLLAYLPEEERKKILEQKGLLRFTEKTITDKKELEKELNKIKKQSFALDREENEKDVRCIAAPIKNYQGKVIAAISISGPVYRIDINKQNHLKEALIRTSKKVSKRLGYNEKV
ncbi:IclR family transcriptional regulator [Candidatus Atribacteria bacterium HGW-Atribacteria-1]|nr:MAG: IclR family transcriptional regulator [Candidatus Atribacteria bacterium HGW-Atribacteria-1]